MKNPNENRLCFSISAIHRFDPDDSKKDLVSRGLKGDWYFLNDWCKLDQQKGVVLNNTRNTKMMKTFFQKRISVQTIVGTNGSGKTSLLDLMYRIINNFSALLERNMTRNAAEELYYVCDVRGEIYFVLNGHIGRLGVFDNDVYFRYMSYELHLNANEGPTSEEDKKVQIKQVFAISKRFFYTIVTNYSLQSFVDEDYAEEECLALPPNGLSTPSENVWINSLFQKNDGYVTPITLNPYRHHGMIDMAKEHRLTLYRLSAIMLNLYNQNISMIDGYELNNIWYKYRRNAIFQKYEDAGAKLEDYANLQELLNNKESLAYIIISKWGYGLYNLDANEEIVRSAYLYLIYKTCSIARTYPKYNEYAEIADVKRIAQTITKSEQSKWKSLISKIRRDESHITTKLTQIRTFITHLPHILEQYPNIADSRFDYETYYRMTGNDKRPNGMWNILNSLPPSLFSIQILLNGVDENGNAKDTEPIDIKRMSSGERQYLYTFSTCIYHIMNLLSIKEQQRVSYRSVNLVFDEVEICFHPEYQRQLISRLLRLLTKLSFNAAFNINVIIATHSPFILSDVPQSNILFLENGVAAKMPSDFVNPFAATISDILHQSFFLRHGFMGEYAQYKLKGILNKLEKDGFSIDDYKNTKERIAIIGDQFLREQLEHKLAQKVGKKWRE